MLDYQEIRLEINLKFIRALVMTDPSICTERDLAKFRSLSKSHSEKSKFLQDFSQVFKERISIQESYVMEMTKLSSQIDALTSQGALNNILITLKAAYQQKLLMEQNFLVVLKKEVTESLEEIVKRHNTEFNTIMVEKKQLEKEHKHFFERTEISQKTHFLQGRERDAMALEIESFNLRRKLADQRQQKASEKLNNMTKIWTHGANEYRTNVGEYNFFLEKFGTTLKKMNMQMRTQEVEKVTFSLGAIKKIVCNEPGLSAPLPEIEKLRNTLEGVNIKQEINESTDSAQSASLKMEVMSYESFLQRELKEITTVNEKEEEIVRSFRKHYEDILKRQVLAETCLFEVPGPESNGEEEKQKHQEIQQNINFLAKLVDIAWRGQPVVTADLKKFHRMLGDKFLRKIFTAAVQQYRLSDKFVLTDDGFKNTTKILVHFLYAIKDATSIMKVMILSLTFWKVDLQKSQEKCYLHSKIVWHPVWRDLDFWSTSILLSIRDELRFQKNLEECETPNETAERERNIVFGQLSSFSYNMVTFMVDKNETKKMLEKFSSYYDLQNEQIKLLLNNIDTMTRQHEQTLVMDKIKKDQEGPKPVVKMSLISNYFGAKKSAVSSDTSDSKSTSDNQMGMEATKMIEEFKIEFEDDSLFHEVYGTNRGFSYGGEAGSVEKFLKQGFSYGSEISISKLDVSQESENRKSQTWF